MIDRRVFLVDDNGMTTYSYPELDPDDELLLDHEEVS